MLTQRQTYFLASLTVALGFGMHGVTRYHLDRKIATQEQTQTSTAALLTAEIDKKRRGDKSGAGPTSEDVANMLNDLKGKTMREKLEVYSLCSSAISLDFTLSPKSHLLHTDGCLRSSQGS